MVVTDTSRCYDDRTGTATYSIESSAVFSISVSASGTNPDGGNFYICGTHHYNYWVGDRGFQSLKCAQDYLAECRSKEAVSRMARNFNLPSVQIPYLKRQVFRPKNMLSRKQRDYQKRKMRLHDK